MRISSFMTPFNGLKMSWHLLSWAMIDHLMTQKDGNKNPAHNHKYPLFVAQLSSPSQVLLIFCFLELDHVEPKSLCWTILENICIISRGRRRRRQYLIWFFWGKCNVSSYSNNNSVFACIAAYLNPTWAEKSLTFYLSLSPVCGHFVFWKQRPHTTHYLDLT